MLLLMVVVLQTFGWLYIVQGNPSRQNKEFGWYPLREFLRPVNFEGNATDRIDRADPNGLE